MRELGKTGVKELIVAHDRVEIRTYERGGAVEHAGGAVAQPVVQTPVAGEEKAAGTASVDAAKASSASCGNGELLEIKAPLPGTLFVAPGKDRNGNPLPGEGEVVEEGAVIALVEAMKMFNDVFAPARGVVKRLAAKNESKVKVGDLVMEIEK